MAQALTYPHLQAAGIDWQALLTQLKAQIGPILAQAAVALLEALLGQLQQQKGKLVKCPAGDCTDVCAHLDMITEAAARIVCCAACAKALCNQEAP